MVYKIKIKKIIEREVTFDAQTPEQAQEKAMRLYLSGELMLDDMYNKNIAFDVREVNQDELLSDMNKRLKNK